MHPILQNLQFIFTILYLATQAAAMALYIRTRALPPWSLALLCLSRRMHSIFVLRLFNDCWAMLLAYVGALLLQVLMGGRAGVSSRLGWVCTRHALPWTQGSHRTRFKPCASSPFTKSEMVTMPPHMLPNPILQAHQWEWAVFTFSAAVSVKMNVLLWAPGVLAILIKAATPLATVRGVAAGAMLQVALALPFLLAAPREYLARAFEFTRAFQMQWSVNWQFLPPKWFADPRFALILLGLHLRFLWSFAKFRWCAKEEEGEGSIVLKMFEK